MKKKGKKVKIIKLASGDAIGYRDLDFLPYDEELMYYGYGFKALTVKGKKRKKDNASTQSKRWL